MHPTIGAACVAASLSSTATLPIHEVGALVRQREAAAPVPTSSPAVPDCQKYAAMLGHISAPAGVQPRSGLPEDAAIGDCRAATSTGLLVMPGAEPPVLPKPSQLVVNGPASTQLRSAVATIAGAVAEGVHSRVGMRAPGYPVCISSSV